MKKKEVIAQNQQIIENWREDLGVDSLENQAFHEFCYCNEKLKVELDRERKASRHR